MGETSDNLPGVPGVGPKTAAKWITTYGDLHGVVANVDQIKGKAGESLREHLDGVLRNRRLNALVRDLELPLGPADLARQQWDRDEVHQVFDGLEFRVLRERLFDDGGRAGARGRVGLRPGHRRAWAPRTSPTGWPSTPAPGVRTGVHVVGSWGRGSG